MTQSRRLPAKQADSTIAVKKQLALTWGVWAYMLAVVLFIGGYAALEFLRGNPIAGAIDIVVMVLLGWSFAGLFIAIPLSLYAMEYGKTHPSEIEMQYRRAISLWNRLHLRKDITYGSLLGTIAFLQHEKGNYDESAEFYEQTVKVLEKHKRGAYPHLAAALNNMGSLYLKQKKYDDADQILKASLNIWEAQKQPEYSGSAIPLTNVGFLRLRQDDLSAAEDVFLQAKRRFEHPVKPGQIIPATVICSHTVMFIGLALTYAKQSKRGDLRSTCEKFFAFIDQEKSAAVGPLSLDILSELAEACLALGETEIAERVIAIAYEVGKNRSEHPDAPKILGLYEKLLTQLGRLEEIPDMKQWLLPGPRSSSEA